MEVKAGYKQTEVGVIPEEWQVRPLFSLCTEIGDGIHATPNYVMSSEFYFVNGNNLVNDWISITDSTMCVSESEYKTLRSNLTDRTLLLSINGTIGNLAFYNGEQVVLGKSAAYINVAKTVSRTFISYCLKSRPTSLFFENELTGTTIRNLSLQSLRNTPFPLPPTIEEQRSIAGALSDMDALIGALDRLIAKKRDLKQGAMQELLTGKRRLPGFGNTGLSYIQSDVGIIPEDWRVVKIKDHASIKTGKRNTQDRVEDGEYPFYVRSQVVERINSYSFDGEAVLTAGDGVGTGKVFHYINGRFDLHQRVYRISDFSSDLNGFFFFLVFSRRFYDRIMALTAKSSVDSVRMEMIANMEIPLPPTADEQTAIATVLSGMDAEIVALEQKRDKTIALKQGMMQELLTGRIRLV